MYPEGTVSGKMVGRSKPITPAVEFRRWLIMASVFAVLAGCVAVLLPVLLKDDLFAKLDIVLGLFYFMISVGEGWIQFDTAGRRVLWSLTGPAVVVVALLSPRTWSVLPFLVPAGIEFFAALGRRRRPWIWLISTPFLIVSLAEFGDALLRRGAKYMMELAPNWFNAVLPVPTEAPKAAVTFAVYLIARAAIGSFIASRDIT